MGIPVSNIPDYCIDEVADQTLAFLLALAEMQLGVAHYVSNARAHDAALAIHGASPN